MKKKKCTVVDGDNWAGIYIDGKLVYENHNVTVYDLNKCFKLGVEFLEPDMEWLDEVGRLPDDLKDVKLLEE